VGYWVLRAFRIERVFILITAYKLVGYWGILAVRIGWLVIQITIYQFVGYWRLRAVWAERFLILIQPLNFWSTGVTCGLYRGYFYFDNYL
jgi:hypothetical protein